MCIFTYDFFPVYSGFMRHNLIESGGRSAMSFAIHLNDTENALPSFWPQTCDAQFDTYSALCSPTGVIPGHKNVLQNKYTLISSTNTLLNKEMQHFALV